MYYLLYTIFFISLSPNILIQSTDASYVPKARSADLHPKTTKSGSLELDMTVQLDKTPAESDPDATDTSTSTTETKMLGAENPSSSLALSRMPMAPVMSSLLHMPSLKSLLHPIPSQHSIFSHMPSLKSLFSSIFLPKPSSYSLSSLMASLRSIISSIPGLCPTGSRRDGSHSVLEPWNGWNIWPRVWPHLSIYSDALSKWENEINAFIKKIECVGNNEIKKIIQEVKDLPVLASIKSGICRVINNTADYLECPIKNVPTRRLGVEHPHMHEPLPRDPIMSSHKSSLLSILSHFPRLQTIASSLLSSNSLPSSVFSPKLIENKEQSENKEPSENEQQSENKQQSSNTLSTPCDKWKNEINEFLKKVDDFLASINSSIQGSICDMLHKASDYLACSRD